jgi:hypothetical protein
VGASAVHLPPALRTTFTPNRPGVNPCDAANLVMAPPALP